MIQCLLWSQALTLLLTQFGILLLQALQKSGLHRSQEGPILVLSSLLSSPVPSLPFPPLSLSSFWATAGCTQGLFLTPWNQELFLMVPWGQSGIVGIKPGLHACPTHCTITLAPKVPFCVALGAQLTCFLTYSTNNSSWRGSSHFWLKKVLQRAAASPRSSERIP